MFHPRTANRAAFPMYGGRLHRQHVKPAAFEQDAGPGLLVSRAFWVGGALSLAAWAALAAAVGVI